MKPDIPRAQIKKLQDVPNVGKACVADLKLLGIEQPEQLIGRDPYRMYDDLCRLTKMRHDPCVYDVFISAVHFMEGAPALPWWHYTTERKTYLLASHAATKTEVK
ncbi:MAG: helix-hairpin-helix domain-containing protein [Cytophaga sp.]|nr:helix-hairpin-helix domain-containing protein [Undibacterium sp.]